MITGKRECSGNLCDKSAVVVLEERTLCLDHFFERCFERLDKLEPKIRRRLVGAEDKAAAQAILEECSSGALLVSLRHEALSNLDRSRLLEILLLCGDLRLLLREPYSRFTDSPSSMPSVLFWKSFPLQRGKEEQKKD
jgi:hypothetical protein